LKQRGPLLSHKERRRNTALTGSSRAANPMNETFGHIWKVIVDDVGDVASRLTNLWFLAGCPPLAFFFDDPDSNLLEYIAMLDDEPQHRARVIVVVE